MTTTPNWRENGVRIVRSGELDSNTPQTPGMTRAAAINYAKAGAEKLWAGTVNIEPDAKTGAHHHGELESVIYVLSGRARMRWGEASLNMSPKPMPAISFMCRPLCRIRRSTPIRSSHWSASSSAAIRKRSWSISILSRPKHPTPSGLAPIIRRIPIDPAIRRGDPWVALLPIPKRRGDSVSRPLATTWVARRGWRGNGQLGREKHFRDIARARR